MRSWICESVNNNRNNPCNKSIRFCKSNDTVMAHYVVYIFEHTKDSCGYLTVDIACGQSF